MRTGLEQELLSPAQLAGELGVPVQTVYQWNYNGGGPVRLRVGRHVRYRRADVDAWLVSCTVPTGTAA